MSAAWQALVLGLWAFVLVQGLLLLVLYRQFGLIYMSQGQARSRDGLAIGSEAPAWQAEDQHGFVRKSQEFDHRPLVLVFADPGCAPCNKLMPHLREVAVERDDVAFVIVGADDPAENLEMALRHGLDLPIVSQVEGDLPSAFNVTATPFAFFLDRHGIVLEKGIVNVREQIEEKLLAVDGRIEREVAA